MGVEFFPCTVCNEVINDCCDVWRCPNCKAKICEDCAREHGLEQDGQLDGDGCPVCSGEVAPDARLLRFALGKMKMTREEIEAKYRAWSKAKGNGG